MVSVHVFWGVLATPVSRSLAAYLNRKENMWASMKNDPATMATLKEKSGSFPRVQSGSAFPPWNAAKASVLETTHMNMNNVF